MTPQLQSRLREALEEFGRWLDYSEEEYGSNWNLDGIKFSELRDVEHLARAALSTEDNNG